MCKAMSLPRWRWPRGPAICSWRLDLLRLKAGAGSQHDLTAHLEAARQVRDRIEGLLDAFREVEAGLRTPTPVT